MTDTCWDVAAWVHQFEAAGGIVFPDGIAMNLSNDREKNRMASEAMCQSLIESGRWEILIQYANSPEHVAHLECRDILLDDNFAGKPASLIEQDYIDAMSEFKGKPSKHFRASRCLELIQRDYFGLLDNEMEFSEASLAACIRQISHELPKTTLAAFFLNGIANALDSEESPWQLKLSRKKWAGRFQPVSHSNTERARWALSALEYYEADGWPTEAAIAKVAELLGGMSRASAFKIVKEGREIQKEIDEILARLEKSNE